MSTTQETVDALLLLGHTSLSNLLAGTLSERYVSPEWVQVVIAGIGRVSQDELAKMNAHLMTGWGSSLDDVTGVQSDPLVKITLIEKVLLCLSQCMCQDTRTDPLNQNLMIVEVVRLSDEGGGVEQVLRPGHCFHVHDPLAFNLVLRRLQTWHPDWPLPRNNSMLSRTTRGITQPLQALGFGPVKASPSAHSAPGARGPPDTDPDKTLVDGIWKSTAASRDGLYFTRYVYDAKRVQVATNIRYVWTKR
jgi:hypothetical protein